MVNLPSVILVIVGLKFSLVRTDTLSNTINSTMMDVDNTSTLNNNDNLTMMIISITSLPMSTAAVMVNNTVLPTKLQSTRIGWFILVCLSVISTIIIGGAVAYYRYRDTPYRRFLRQWQVREEDPDDIILQIEQPEIVPQRWTNRISFS